jgi:hypothetical protein
MDVGACEAKGAVLGVGELVEMYTTSYQLCLQLPSASPQMPEVIHCD